MTEYTRRIIETIKSVPAGRVCTYGGIAALAGNARGARQVARVLHSSSEKHRLPWHRVINAEGRIVLKDPAARDLQRALLQAEGVRVNSAGSVDLRRYLWRGPY